MDQMFDNLFAIEIPCLVNDKESWESFEAFNYQPLADFETNIFVDQNKSPKHLKKHLRRTGQVTDYLDEQEKAIQKCKYLVPLDEISKELREVTNNIVRPFSH